MKTIDNYIIEKLHLNKDIEIPHYVVILKYLIRPKCEYEICTTTDEVIKVIRKNHTFNNVYKIDDLKNLDKLFDSLWEFKGEENDREYLKSIGVERCTDDIRQILRKNTK
ncbi:MAG: hypothetical protein IJH39_05250 [Clostridia bacterium]|nr:hypothetical protein [Clostridia bacterium]